jgi:hypothetical protein
MYIMKKVVAVLAAILVLTVVNYGLNLVSDLAIVSLVVSLDITSSDLIKDIDALRNIGVLVASLIAAIATYRKLMRNSTKAAPETVHPQ